MCDSLECRFIIPVRFAITNFSLTLKSRGVPVCVCVSIFLTAQLDKHYQWLFVYMFCFRHRLQPQECVITAAAKWRIRV